MKIYHNTQIIDGKECIMLYVDYPSDYEFSFDLDKLKQNALDLSSKIRDYALKNFKNLTNDTTILILNGVALGTLLTAALINKFNVKAYDKLNTEQTQLEQSINQDNNNVENTSTDEKKETVSEEVEENLDSSTDSSTNTSSNIQNQVLKSTTKSEVTNTSSKATPTPASTPAPAPTPAPQVQSEQPKPAVTNEKMINLKLNSGQIISISLEDYVVGVVGAEMPASFNSEALKAQAVAARTYALKRTAYGATLSASTSDQVYKTDDQLRSLWAGSFNTYYNKVRNAVLATKGQYLTYNGNYIDALYFSTSNGRTENAENVWGNSFPYLVSVESPWDVGIPSYSGSKTVSMQEISDKIGATLTSSSQIEILERTQGNRVKTISICGKIFTGVQIRTMFNLKSADFDISASGSNIVFTTRGYGHGVGMSQYGANLMAKSGYDYKSILKHYYTGVEIKS